MKKLDVDLIEWHKLGDTFRLPDEVRFDVEEASLMVTTKRQAFAITNIIKPDAYIIKDDSIYILSEVK